jgi:hypothetical protein
LFCPRQSFVSSKLDMQYNSPRTIHRAQIIAAQFTAHNSPYTIHRAQFTVAQFIVAQFTLHNSPRTIYGSTIHRRYNSSPAQFTAAQFTAHNPPYTIHRATFHRGTIHRTQSTAHNSPNTIHRSTFHYAQFIAHNSPRKIKIPLGEFLILLDYCLKPTNKNKPMAPTILERGLPICGLRPNHVCEVSRRLFQLRIGIGHARHGLFFIRLDCKSNAKPSEKEKDHNLPGQSAFLTTTPFRSSIYECKIPLNDF